MPSPDAAAPVNASPEILAMLTLSTGHLPHAVRVGIDAIATPGAAFPADDWRSRFLAAPWFGYGWILYVPEDEGEELPFPAALRDCLALARPLRADFLKFDCDVEPVAGLFFYDDNPVPPRR